MKMILQREVKALYSLKILCTNLACKSVGIPFFNGIQIEYFEKRDSIIKSTYISSENLRCEMSVAQSGTWYFSHKLYGLFYDGL